MGQGRRRKQAIDSGNRFDRIHTSPLIGHGVVDAEHAPVERRRHIQQLSFQLGRLGRIARADKLDALSDFAKDKHAQKDVLISY